MPTIKCPDCGHKNPDILAMGRTLPFTCNRCPHIWRLQDVGQAPAATHVLTKVDSAALWRAVDAMREQYRAMKTMPDLAEQLPAARLELARAGAALRKVQALVRKPKAVKS